MGCARSLPLPSSNYVVEECKDAEADKLHDRYWAMLPKAVLLRVAAEAKIGAWRLGLVCQVWRDAVRDVPRRVRFQLQTPELDGEQIEWIRKSGDCVAQWRVEAIGDKGAALAGVALRCNAAFRDFGVYCGRSREGALSLRGASKLALAIAGNRELRLERIDLSGCTIKHFGAVKLCRALTTAATAFPGGSGLAWLDLTRNDIGDEGAASVASYISAEGKHARNGQALRHVNLSANSIGSSGLAALAAAATATSSGCHLETCILSTNPLAEDDGNGSAPNGTTKSLTSLVHALHATLRTLEIAGCGLGRQGTGALAAAWAKQPVGLTSLDLSKNGIGNGGATALANLLVGGGCPHLVTLSLASNEIGDAGAAQLARGARAEACQLRELDLGDNRIGDDGAIALSLALDASAGLVQLHHSSNAIGAAGAEAIARRIPKPHLLVELRPAG